MQTVVSQKGHLPSLTFAYVSCRWHCGQINPLRLMSSNSNFPIYHARLMVGDKAPLHSELVNERYRLFSTLTYKKRAWNRPLHPNV
jgi:hypothetical protein